MKFIASNVRIMILCFLIGGGGVWAVMGVVRDLGTWKQAYASCEDGSECARLAKLFTNDYTESRDLAKSFLTLLVAVFVASVTFSEKIVDMHKAGPAAKVAMIACWIFLLAAIICCGTGMAYMVFAYGIVVYTPEMEYRFFETRAAQLFLASGLVFGGGLSTMLLAGLSTFIRTPASARLVVPVRAGPVPEGIAAEGAD